MDWTSATLGAFFASAFIFGGTAAALFAIMRQQFLLWLVARITALTVMVWALSPLLPNLLGIGEAERLLAGAVATDISLAVCGPLLASYIERRVVVRQARRLLRLMLPVSLIPIALLPAVIFAGKLDWLHDLVLLGFAGMLVWALFESIRKGSRAALFQAMAWTPALSVGFAALLHELIVGGMMHYYLTAMVFAVMLEFVVTTMGVADGFMRVKDERDRALADMRAAKLATALDPLTNIANRRGLEQHFNSSVNRRPDGIAIVDCDHFKQINDSFGHDVGDKVLVAAANGLQGEDLFVARLGGEEFVLLVYADNWQDVAETARRRLTIAIRDAVADLPYPVTASAGLSAMQPEDTLQSAMKRADRALYAAKESGRNRSLTLSEFRPSASLSEVAAS